jgi:hypothetical protein
VFNFRVRLEVMGIQLKDGGVYARADGSEHEVYYDDIDIDHPWRHHMGATYTDDGYYYDSGDVSNLDLIRVVSEPDESVPTEVLLAEIATLEADRDGWKGVARHYLALYESSGKEAAGWRKICEGHALRLEALGEKP